MKNFNDCMQEYKRQMQAGTIIRAYRGLMEYLLDLKNTLKQKYPGYHIPNNMYFGFMDMSYFPLFPDSLKDKGLKIAVVFLHESCRFEVWLSGKNKDVMRKYWQLFDACHWDKYRVVSPEKGVDSIVEHILADNPDFSDLPGLTAQIETGVTAFIDDITGFLTDQRN